MMQPPPPPPVLSGLPRARARSACGSSLYPGPCPGGITPTHSGGRAAVFSHVEQTLRSVDIVADEPPEMQSQVRQVMTDLVSVLDELRTVVGDIKSLVTQIDVVTHRMDQTVSSSSCEGTPRRRASSSGADRTPGSHPMENTVKSSHPYNPTPVGSAKKRSRFALAELKHFLEKGLMPHLRVDNLRLPTDINHNSKRFVVLPGARKVSDKSKRNSTGHDYVNIVITGNERHDPSSSPSPDNKPSSPRHDYVNVDVIDTDDDHTPPPPPTLDCSTFNCGVASATKSHIPDSDDSDENTTTGSCGSPRIKPSATPGRSNHHRVSPFPPWSPMSTSCSSSSSPAPSSVDSRSQDEENNSVDHVEYSGLYEREMEDSLELEITEYKDILGQNSDLSLTRGGGGGGGSGGSSESDDYVDWETYAVEASRKRAEILAWTRSSWVGKKVYHVSLDHSLGYSESADDWDDDNDDSDDDEATARLRGLIFPPTAPNNNNMNKQRVDFSWRAVIEP